MGSPGSRRRRSTPLGVVALALLPGCSLFAAKQPAASTFLTSNEAQGSVEVQAADCKGCKPAPRTFYLISADQLKRVRSTSGLTYLGTDADHRRNADSSTARCAHTSSGAAVRTRTCRCGCQPCAHSVKATVRSQPGVRRAALGRARG